MFSKVVLISLSLAVIEIAGQPECACLSSFEPVCSTDLVMFPNECVLTCYSDKIMSEKAVYVNNQCVCDCPTDWSPVCATDLSVQRNQCFLKCHGKTESSEHYYNPEFGSCDSL